MFSTCFSYFFFFFLVFFVPLLFVVFVLSFVRQRILFPFPFSFWWNNCCGSRCRCSLLFCQCRCISCSDKNVHVLSTKFVALDTDYCHKVVFVIGTVLILPLFTNVPVPVQVFLCTWHFEHLISDIIFLCCWWFSHICLLTCTCF